MNISVTGHRPNKLGGYKTDAITLVDDFAYLALQKFREANPGLNWVYTGMAQGWDQSIAWACGLLEVPYIACLPVPEFDKPWPSGARRRYDTLLAKAHQIIDVYNIPGYDLGNPFQQRNEYMVNNTEQTIALYNGTGGGTDHCVRLAKQKRNHVLINVWDDFIKLGVHT